MAQTKEEAYTTAENVDSYLKGLIEQMVARRREIHMTQRELAEIVGVKQPSIARFERGETTPRFDTLVKIVYALNMDIHFVLKG